ncbi:MAG: BCCT family transporter [Hellea sp.]|nr:BCCT family transporter [Hellea sp.]
MPKKAVLYPSLIFALFLGICFVAFPGKMSTATETASSWIKTKTGWLYLIFGVAAFFYAVWLSFGKYGSVRLGEPNERPEFSTPHWVAMMFTAGIGAGLVTWAFGEPIYYIQSPPFGIEPMSTTAYEWAHLYPFIHWGFVPWAFYAVAAVPIAYSLYIVKRPFLRISESCEEVLPETGKPFFKNAIDVLIIMGIIAGTTTSLGIGVPLLSALIAELTGIEDSFLIKMSVLIVWVLIFGTSTVRGLKRGIQKLADLNMILAGFLMAILLVIGPTLFILNMTTNSLGIMLNDFFRIVLWTDPIDQSTFPRDWTIFYWAWWLAFAAFVGLFIARISRGRTIRQVCLGTIIWGSLGTLSYLAIAGGYALHLQFEEILPLTEIMAANEPNGLSVMTAKIAANMPFGKVSLIFFMVLCTVFYATTMDSAAYIAAGVSSEEFDVKQDPSLALRFTWIGILFLMTVGTVLTDNLKIVMDITVIGSLPILPIIVLMCWSLNRQLKRDFGDVKKPPGKRPLKGLYM